MRSQSAALGLRTGRRSTPRIGLHALRQQLLRDDCLLLRAFNEDPRDLARRVVIRASSEQPNGNARLIANGRTRSLHQPEKSVENPPITAPPGVFPAGSHRWMSQPGDPWIELRWPEPISVSRIEIVFDTGMHRLLTLSMADGYTGCMIWDEPQPETVRDLEVAAWLDGGWQTVARIEENHQRRRSVSLTDPVATDRIRLTVHRTNGSDHARLFEVRVYSPDSCGPFLRAAPLSR